MLRLSSLLPLCCSALNPSVTTFIRFCSNFIVSDVVVDEDEVAALDIAAAVAAAAADTALIRFGLELKKLDLCLKKKTVY